MDLERASAAYAIWRWLRREGLADISLANRLAPVRWPTGRRLSPTRWW